ncbi:MAG: HD-GYP domain-containing protein [Chloroflexi bacterium]|nr:HD-GYP domain-containing protein [Chloroflexota bacterium]
MTSQILLGPVPALDVRLAMTEAQLVEYARDLRTIYQAERRRREELENAYRATLLALSRALDLRDTETEEHSQRVTRYSLAIGRELGLDGADLAALELGATLHDVGKIGVPDAILRKPGPLSDEEWAIMRRHPQLGYTILRGVDFLAPCLPVVLHHHEKWNGAGYPAGLAGEAIPLAARIFAIADAYDAITSPRPYKAALPAEVAVERICKDAGTHFDPAVVEAFLRVPPALSAPDSPRQIAPNL